MTAALVIVLLLSAAVIVGWLYVGIRKRPGFHGKSAWHEAAEALGLEFVARVPDGGARFTGEAGGFPLSFELTERPAETDGEVQVNVRVEVDGRTRMTERLAFESRGATGAPRRIAGEGVLSGDEAFDGAIVCGGPPALVAAVLDARSRTGLLRVVSRWEAVVFGAKIVLDPGWMSSSAWPRDIEGLVADMVATAAGLDVHDGRTVPERLAEVVGSDPELGVRERCLTLLLRRYRRTAEASGAAGAMLNDPAPEARLVAARLLGASGFPPLTRLVEDTNVPPAVRREALEHLVEHQPEARNPPLLLRLLAEDGGPSQARLIELIAERQYAPAVPRLVELSESGDRRERTSIVEALEAIGDASAEPGLLAILEREVEGGGLRAAPLVRAVVGALGVVGGEATLERLGDLSEAPTTSESLRSQAAESIAAIEARRAAAAPKPQSSWLPPGLTKG